MRPAEISLRAACGLMINAVLDQAQKLFGKGFAIAGFVPGVLLVVLAVDLWKGDDKLVEIIRNAQSTGWDKIAPKVLLAVVAAYLLAYILYGIRAALYAFFSGDFPIFLRWLAPLLLSKERMVRRNRQDHLDAKLAALNAPSWALGNDFAKAFSPEVLSVHELARLLRRTRHLHAEMIRRLDAQQIASGTKYAEILRDAHLLQANQNRSQCPAWLKSDIEQLIDDIRVNFKKAEHGRLQLAARDFDESCRREWRGAYSELYEYFPRLLSNLRPTRFGNVSMVLEMYSYERYGIPLSELWPRLNPFLTADDRARIDDGNTYLDFTVIMAFCSLLGVALAGAAAIHAYHGNRSAVPWHDIILLAALLLSFQLFYRLAIESTRSFGLLIQSAVDLKRGEVLKAFGITAPVTLDQERQHWSNIHDFIAQSNIPTGGQF
jgi:hypothetical protein